MSAEPDWLKNSKFGRIDPDEWPLKGPYGPMLHRDTGESYQGRMARLEFEYQQRMKKTALGGSEQPSPGENP